MQLLAPPHERHCSRGAAARVDRGHDASPQQFGGQANRRIGVAKAAEIVVERLESVHLVTSRAQGLRERERGLLVERAHATDRARDALGEAPVAALSRFQEKWNEAREQLVADRFALVLEPTLKCRRKIRLVVAEYGANLIERGEPFERLETAIERLDRTDDEKAALWLLAWSEQERPVRRRVAKEALASLAGPAT